MTDILRVLPHFPISQYASLIPTLEKNQVTLTDLITLEAADLGKRTQLPLLDLKRLCNALLDALHSDLGVSEKGHDASRSPGNQPDNSSPSYGSAFRHTLPTLAVQWSTISTLDSVLDASLSGGIPTGTITEIAGEAGAGKTQFLLALLLAVQLPPPYGTGKRALYISTEAPLSTRRLTQMLIHNQVLLSAASMTPASTPSLDNIVSTTTPDLESQEHILTYQVPVQIERSNIGLIVLDSVAANYRAEFDRAAPADGSAKGVAGGRAGQSSNMGTRSAELVRLGMLLRELAIKYNLAVVVSNQVADRFGAGSPVLSRTQLRVSTAPKTPYAAEGQQGGGAGYPYRLQESPLAARSKVPNPPPLPPLDEPTSSIADVLPRSSVSLFAHDDHEPQHTPAPPPRLPPPPDDAAFDTPAPPALTFDHQQRWFTGWGDDPAPASAHGMKTPSLGLVWATQVACRIALFKAPRYGRSRFAEDEDGIGGGRTTLKTWRRWAKVVYAPHAPPGGPGRDGAVEFEIGMGGVGSVVRKEKGRDGKG